MKFYKNIEEIKSNIVSLSVLNLQFYLEEPAVSILHEPKLANWDFGKKIGEQ